MDRAGEILLLYQPTLSSTKTMAGEMAVENVAWWPSYRPLTIVSKALHCLQLDAFPTE
jgi:hypothetical protein